MTTLPEALWLAGHLAGDFKTSVSVLGDGWISMTVQRLTVRATTVVPETATAEQVYEAINALVWDAFVRPQLAKAAPNP